MEEIGFDIKKENKNLISNENILKELNEKYNNSSIEELEKSLLIQNKKPIEISFISKRIEDINEKLIIEKYKSLITDTFSIKDENNLSPKTKDILLKNSSFSSTSTTPKTATTTTTEATASLSFGVCDDNKINSLKVLNQPTISKSLRNTTLSSTTINDTKQISIQFSKSKDGFDTINIVWKDAANYESQDWVALYNYEDADSGCYVTNTWYWASKYTNGIVETGVVYDANRVQQVRYYNGNRDLISSYTIKSKCWIDITGDLGSPLQVVWPNSSTANGSDVISIHSCGNNEPSDISKAMSSVYANSSDGNWISSDTINKGLPYYAVYWTLIDGGLYIKQACSKVLPAVHRKIAIGEYCLSSNSSKVSIAAFYDSNSVDKNDLIYITNNKPKDRNSAGPGYLAKEGKGIVIVNILASPSQVENYWATYCSYDYENDEYYIREQISSFDYYCWITDNYIKLKDRKVRKLILPGSHDSATYDIETGSKRSPDGINVNSPDSLLIPWSKTQSSTIYKQLCYGIRYFDLRVASNQFELCIIHNFYSCTVGEVLDDIFKYSSKNPNEVIILHWSHLYFLSEDDNKRLMKMILTKLGKLLSNSNKGTDVKVGDLSGTPIICIYDDSPDPSLITIKDNRKKIPDTLIRDPRFWDSSVISTEYETSRYHNFESVLRFLKSRINVPKRKVFYVYQAILTIEFSLNFFLRSLLSWTVDHRNQFNQFFDDLETFASPTNIIMTDFVTFYPLTSYCIRRNTLEYIDN
ncbi:hypothetical protein RB653_000876 [Dictyostelium firmibasis]|uniref:Phosphatidylinositol-specific phospholipase C X domain-containing protein n=1 Tax=Dictyostelium firmibasis TaxID=79012 RepID=A0AAN7YY90_9MYCE